MSDINMKTFNIGRNLRGFLAKEDRMYRNRIKKQLRYVEDKDIRGVQNNVIVMALELLREKRREERKERRERRDKE